MNKFFVRFLIAVITGAFMGYFSRSLGAGVVVCLIAFILLLWGHFVSHCLESSNSYKFLWLFSLLLFGPLAMPFYYLAKYRTSPSNHS